MKWDKLSIIFFTFIGFGLFILSVVLWKAFQTNFLHFKDCLEF